MPVVLRLNGFRLLFYANEGSPLEPMHLHVLRDGIDAKSWLWPDVTPAHNGGLNARTLRELIEIIEPRRDEIARVWNGFFADT